MSKSKVIIVMGVSGCGKTTISKLLSERMGIPYYDADDFHPQSNIDKMQQNSALDDGDRLPWLLTLAKKLELWESQGSVVLACSALKEAYRKILASKVRTISWILLSGSFDEIKSRLENRHGHYMKADLLKSQFADLEVPDYALSIDITESPEHIVNNIISKINSNG